MSRWVLDASAVLALIQREPGQDRVRAAMIDGATISAMNLAEVVGKLTDANMDESQIRSVLADLVMSVSPFTEENAYGTGLLRRSTRALGLSLADRACLNLAEILSLPAMTTEAAWLRIQGSPQVEKIR